MTNHFLLALSVCAYVFYIFALLFMVFLKRRAAVRSGVVSYKYFKTFSGDDLPDELVIAARHVNNQFQLPPIFMVTAVLLLGFETIPFSGVVLGWAFLVTRFIHTYVHLGSNKPLHRAMVYMMGWFVIFAMWVQIMCLFV